MSAALKRILPAVLFTVGLFSVPQALAEPRFLTTSGKDGGYYAVFVTQKTKEVNDIWSVLTKSIYTDGSVWTGAYLVNCNANNKSVLNLGNDHYEDDLDKEFYANQVPFNLWQATCKGKWPNTQRSFQYNLKPFTLTFTFDNRRAAHLIRPSRTGEFALFEGLVELKDIGFVYCGTPTVWWRDTNQEVMIDLIERFGERGTVSQKIHSYVCN